MRFPRRSLLASLAALACAPGFTAPAPASAVAGPATIDSQWVSNVTEHNATLHAEINPNGLLTKYKLQIDTTGRFKFDQTDGCALHPPEIGCTGALVVGDPLPPGLVEPPEGTIPAGTEPVHVSANLGAIGAVLQPETTYYYRAIAANAPPIVWGPTQTFTTPSAAPPSIDAVWASDLTDEGATLNARINPNGRYTGYWLQIDDDPDYDFTQPNCPFSLPGYVRCLSTVMGEPLPEGLIEPEPDYLEAGFGSREVSQPVGVLQPNTEYHYRALASNDGTVVTSPDQTFTTPSLPDHELDSPLPSESLALLPPVQDPTIRVPEDRLPAVRIKLRACGRKGVRRGQDLGGRRHRVKRVCVSLAGAEISRR